MDEKTNQFDYKEFINKNLIQLVVIFVVLVLMVIAHDSLTPAFYIGFIVVLTLYILTLIIISKMEKRFEQKIKKRKLQAKNNNEL